MIQLQGDQRKDVQEFLVDKKEGLELDAKTIKVTGLLQKAITSLHVLTNTVIGPWVLDPDSHVPATTSILPCRSHNSRFDNGMLLGFR